MDIKTRSNICFLAIAFIMIAVPTHAQMNVVLQVDDDDDCIVGITADSQVTIQSNGDLTIKVNGDDLRICFGGGGGAPLDVILAVTPTSIKVDESVNVSWSIENYVPGSTSCTVSGPSAWQSKFNTSLQASPYSGSGDYTLTNDATFSISCSNSGDSAQISVAVVGGGPEYCDDGFPCPNLTLCPNIPENRALPFDVTLSGFPVTLNPPDGQPKVDYAGVFGDVWPTTVERYVRIPRGKYVAIPFTAVDTASNWRIDWSDGITTGNGNMVTLSRCPGDFDFDGLDSSCRAAPNQTGGTMVARTGVSGVSCDLIAGETYYLNVEHARYDDQGARTELCDRPSFCDFFVD